jgi:uncharacterized membrane protein YdcZ (DUF606 family)
MTINFVTGFIFVLAYFVMSNVEQTRDLAKVLVNVFRFFPGYLIGEGLINIATTYLQNVYYNRNISYLSFQGMA